MAIDTENRRRSAGPRLFGMAGMGIMPKPDGTIDVHDRVHYAGFYRGVTITEQGNKSMLLHVYNQYNPRL